MHTFVIIFFMFSSMFALMAVGVYFKRKPITGSCGGLGNVGIEKTCDCDNPCDKKQKRSHANSNKNTVEEAPISFF